MRKNVKTPNRDRKRDETRDGDVPQIGWSLFVAKASFPQSTPPWLVITMSVILIAALLSSFVILAFMPKAILIALLRFALSAMIN